MKAKDVMTPNVVTIEPQATILQAVRIMLQNRFSGLPVVNDDGRLVGMVTEGDLLRRAETATRRQRPRLIEYLLGPGRLAADYTRAHGRKVEEIMTRDPVTVTEDTPLDVVVTKMEKQRIKRLPVMRGEKLVGLVSRANLVRALASAARDINPAETSDAQIREKLWAELRNERWAPIGALEITVRGGVVELWGTITDERQREALVVAAENIPGVNGVRDHLVWFDTSGTAFYAPEPAPDKKAG